jgi:ribose transport system substrate-binding protein
MFRTPRALLIIPLVLAATTIAVSACSEGHGSQQLRVTLIQGEKGNPFYSTMACGAQEAAKRLGVSLDVTAPDQFDPSLQTPIVNGVAAKNPTGVLIAPTDAVAMRAPIKQLVDGGSKVAEVDTALQDTSVSFTHLTTDNVAAGQAAAAKFNELLHGKGKVLALSSAPGISTNDDRINEFKKALARYPGLQFGGVQYTKEDATTAASMVSASLAASPDINGIYSVNSPSTQGAATSLRNQGANQVKLIGFDAGPQQIQQLQQGSVAALVAQSPYQIGQEGVQAIVNAQAGKPVPRFEKTPVMLIEQQNLNSPQTQQFIYKTNC